MGISHYLKDIGRGARGAKSLSREQARDLLGQVLDGTASDLEIGAFCLAMRIKGETPEEMCGFLDATHERIALLPASDLPLVVLPSYNGARKLPVLTPLLALLLARQGLPVLLHGMRTEARRVLASDVLLALDIPALVAPKKIALGEVFHIHTQHLHAGLARLLAVRDVVGLRNPGHSVVKLLNPCAGPAVVVSAYTHPEYLPMLHTTLSTLSATALLSRGLEGEVATDPRRTPRYDGFVHGVHSVLDEQQPGTAGEVPGLPNEIDIATTATYTRRVLAAELPVPPAIERQVQHIVGLAQQLALDKKP
ncbi:MAG: DNA-binding protein YbiB [Burkholderiaceae bacterium]|nr:DNA-binding protein YbiB [Burkholderiaceae bacterium]